MRYISRKHTVKVKKKFMYLVVCLILFLLIVDYKYYLKSQQKTKNNTSTAIQSENKITPKATIASSLHTLIQDILKDKEGSYGVVIKNLNTGEKFLFNEHRKFQAASLYKLWILGATYIKIQTGDLKSDKEISSSISDLNTTFNIATEDAELVDGEISLPINTALKQMVTISHNYAALLLTKTIKMSYVKRFLEVHGYDDSSVGDIPYTSAFDIAKFFEDLYSEKLLNKEFSEESIEMLKNQTLNSKIPRLMEDEYKIAHKTGELGSYSHDAGIVFGEKGNYLIVVLSESEKPDEANEVIAEISKTTVDYFEK